MGDPKRSNSDFQHQAYTTLRTDKRRNDQVDQGWRKTPRFLCVNRDGWAMIRRGPKECEKMTDDTESSKPPPNTNVPDENHSSGVLDIPLEFTGVQTSGSFEESNPELS